MDLTIQKGNPLSFAFFLLIRNPLQNYSRKLETLIKIVMKLYTKNHAVPVISLRVEIFGIFAKLQKRTNRMDRIETKTRFGYLIYDKVVQITYQNYSLKL